MRKKSARESPVFRALSALSTLSSEQIREMKIILSTPSTISMTTSEAMLTSPEMLNKATIIGREGIKKAHENFHELFFAKNSLLFLFAFFPFFFFGRSAFHAGR